MRKQPWQLVTFAALAIALAVLDVLRYATDGGAINLVFAACWLAIGTLESLNARDALRDRNRVIGAKQPVGSVVYVVGDPFDTELNPQRRAANARKLTEPS